MKNPFAVLFAKIGLLLGIVAALLPAKLEHRSAGFKPNRRLPAFGLWPVSGLGVCFGIQPRFRPNS